VTNENPRKRRRTEEELSAEVLHCLRRLTHAIDQHSSALARGYGLTGPQLAALQTLARLGEGSASELARHLSLSQPTMTGIVQRMIQKGLVSRRPSEWDRRVSLLTPTQEGRRILAQSPPLLRKPFMDRLATMETPEQEQLLHCLQQIVSMIEHPPFTSQGGTPRSGWKDPDATDRPRSHGKSTLEAEPA